MMIREEGSSSRVGHLIRADSVTAAVGALADIEYSSFLHIWQAMELLPLE